MMSSNLSLLVFLPFIACIFAALLPTNARNWGAGLAGGVALICAIQVAFLFPEVTNGNVITQTIHWVPSLGLNFTLRLDGFSWLFSMLVFGIGSLVSLYARYYMSPQDPIARFFSYFLAFMGAMAGVVLSGNLIQIVMFWELTSLFSFLLIGYWYHRKEARRGARTSLTVTGLGGLCMLGGMLILGHIVGSYEMSTVLESGAIIRKHPLYTPMLCLILLGTFTKSAQFPFHFWLPRAMAAPTPVSAYLHSATMVKAGIYLMARLWPVLSGTDEWFYLVAGSGVITLLLGGYAAFFQNDLKAVLAYSTISHLGLITLLLGLGSQAAAVAAVFHTINHAIFKASLFMAAGIIDHETGTRDIRKLSGLMKSMPITGALCFVASAAMAGVPLLNGFLSKEMFFAQTVYLDESSWMSWTLPLLATIAGMFSVAYSLRFTLDVFMGPPAVGLPHDPHEPKRWMRVPMEFLVLLCLLIGIFPYFSVAPILQAAAIPVAGHDLPYYNLAIWHGLTPPLIMSIVAMIGGIYFYLALKRQIKLGVFAGVPLLGWINGQAIFNRLILLLLSLAKHLNAIFTTQKLQAQISILLLMALFTTSLPFWTPEQSLQFTFGQSSSAISIPFLLMWVVGIGCALGAAWGAKFHRFAALIMLGITGLMTCMTFMWFSAPDLALTQLTVEVVTVILILLGLRWLPRQTADPEHFHAFGTRMRRVRDMLLALFAGLGVAVLAYMMMTNSATNPSVAEFYLQTALSEGDGANVVNVMLVDFRNFDTIGEITVLGVVALTVFALLRRFRPAHESTYIPLQQIFASADIASSVENPVYAKDTAIGYMMIPAVLVRFILPLAMLASAYFFMRGHNAPGGGFVAGLIFASAFILQYIVAGTQWVEANMRLYPQKLISYGLIAALLTGLGSMFVGYPFLTTHTPHFDVPWVGEIHIPSATFFDLGVFLVVVGATILILTAIAHQSVRGRRAREIEVEEHLLRDAELISRKDIRPEDDPTLEKM
ncbi:MAG: monovalent cation/H+ antiporter subunit A [Saezia sp.]